MAVDLRIHGGFLFYSIEDVICVFSSAVIAGRSVLHAQVGGCSLRLGFARWIIGGFFFVDILGGREQIRTPEGTVVSSAILKVLGITVATPRLWVVL